MTKVVYKISESNAQAIDLSHQSKNLDKELGYFEGQNSYHQSVQNQMIQEHQSELKKCQDFLQVQQEKHIYLKKLDEDEKAIDYETDRLQKQTEQMNADFIELRAEAESLNTHMTNLNY